MSTRASQAATARWFDLAVAALVTLLGLAVWIETGHWFEARNLAQDPTVLPRSIAVTLWLVAAGMSVRFVRGRRMAARADRASSADPETSTDESEAAAGGSFLGAVAALLTMAVYVWLAFRLGWIVVTWVFLVGAGLILGRDRVSGSRLLVAIVVATVAIAVLWFGFIELLGVRMPSTLLL